jgi:hypothetical protein
MRYRNRLENMKELPLIQWIIRLAGKLKNREDWLLCTAE